MAACRIITHCADPDDDDDIYVHSATQLTPPRLPNATSLRFANNRYPPRPEVHVTTDHIVMEDFECVVPLPRGRPKVREDADELLLCLALMKSEPKFGQRQGAVVDGHGRQQVLQRGVNRLAVMLAADSSRPPVPSCVPLLLLPRDSFKMPAPLTHHVR